MREASESRTATSTDSYAFIVFLFADKEESYSRINIMRPIQLVIILVGLIIGCTPTVQAKTLIEDSSYEITGAGIGVQGSYLIEVSASTKDKNLSNNDLIRVGIHGVLFKGFANPITKKFQKPLAGYSANEIQHVDFYKAFFSNDGSATNYGSVIEGSRKVVKVGKKYCITATVQINKEALLQYLQSAGVVRSLNSAF